jgi:hypothetical protein
MEGRIPVQQQQVVLASEEEAGAVREATSSSNVACTLVVVADQPDFRHRDLATAIEIVIRGHVPIWGVRG